MIFCVVYEFSNGTSYCFRASFISVLSLVFFIALLMTKLASGLLLVTSCLDLISSTKSEVAQISYGEGCTGINIKSAIFTAATNNFAIEGAPSIKTKS